MSGGTRTCGTVSIRQATDADLELARSWLLDANLPIADLTVDHMPAFLLGTDDDEAIGMVGLEQQGKYGLLRSLVVDRRYRGAGVGSQLVAALEAQAAAAGISELWLLTIDADPYFARLGYEIAERVDAPDAIRDTAEFSSLCPVDAVLMQKNL